MSEGSWLEGGWWKVNGVVVVGEGTVEGKRRNRG